MQLYHVCYIIVLKKKYSGNFLELTLFGSLPEPNSLNDSMLIYFIIDF